MPDVPGIILWEAPETSLWVGDLQEAQVGGWNWASGQADLPTAPERPGAVLPHRPDVYLCAVHCEGAQGPWHGIGRTGARRDAGESNCSGGSEGVCLSVSPLILIRMTWIIIKSSWWFNKTGPMDHICQSSFLYMKLLFPSHYCTFSKGVICWI